MASTTPSGSKRKEESIRSSSPASLSKKKKCSYSSDKCLFCQGNTSGELRISSDDGRSKAVQCAIERRNLNDKASDSIIERVLTVISKNSDCCDIKLIKGDLLILVSSNKELHPSKAWRQTQICTSKA